MKLLYFYAKDGQKIGPLTREQLDDLHLSPDTLVWHYGLSNWIEYSALAQETSPRNASLKMLFATLRNKCYTMKSKIKINNLDNGEKSLHATDILKLKSIALKSLIAIIILLSCIGVFYAINFYVNTYRPEKLLEKVCIELEDKWINSGGMEKIDLAEKILTPNTVWGYKGVSDYNISKRFAEPKRDEAVEFMEDKICEELEEEWTTAVGENKIELALSIISKNTTYGHKFVTDDIIFKRYAKPKISTALKILENKANNGDGYDKFLLGQIYGTDDYVVDTDYYKAAYWWKKAADVGSISGFCNLGWAYEYGKGVSKNMEKAVEYYRKAANANSAYGLYNLGRLYETGVKVESSSYHYEKYEIEAFSAPYSSEDIFVCDKWEGPRYLCVYKRKVQDYKTILPKDINKARQLWEKAAKQGYQEAIEKLQRVY